MRKRTKTQQQELVRLHDESTFINGVFSMLIGTQVQALGFRDRYLLYRDTGFLAVVAAISMLVLLGLGLSGLSALIFAVLGYLITLIGWLLRWRVYLRKQSLET